MVTVHGLPPQPLDLAELAREVATRLGTTGTSLITVHGDAAPIAGDRFLLGQAIENLLANAVAASPPGGAVEVTVAPGLVIVRDRGPGIPEWAVARLGTRFFSVGTRPDGRRGSGLGLAFVREAARLHGGTCTLANRDGGGAEAVMRVRA